MSYRISLQVFEGPLDLLLTLIEKEEMEISAISLTRIVQQYLDYLQEMEAVDFETMSSFLFITMELMQLKRRSLLPEDSREIEAEDGVPLITLLKEYQVFRLAAKQLQKLRVQQEQIFQRPSPLIPREEMSGYPFIPPSLTDLMSAYLEGMAHEKRERKSAVYHPLQETCTLEEQMDFIREAVHPGDICFYQLCQGLTLLDFIVTFLSLLELVRLGEVGVTNREGGLRIYGRG